MPFAITDCVSALVSCYIINYFGCSHHQDLKPESVGAFHVDNWPMLPLGLLPLIQKGVRQSSTSSHSYNVCTRVLWSYYVVNGSGGHTQVVTPVCEIGSGLFLGLNNPRNKIEF